MVPLKLETFRNGDGYLTVDWQDWLNDRAYLSVEETESLSEWLDSNSSNYYPTEQEILKWAESKYGPTSGFYGDSNSLTVSTQMSESFLDCGNYFQGLFFHTETGPTFFVMNAIPHTLYADILPDVYIFNGDDDSDILRWDSAYGRCDGSESHMFSSDDAIHLYLDGSTANTFRIDALVKHDEETNTGRLACPLCDHNISMEVA